MTSFSYFRVTGKKVRTFLIAENIALTVFPLFLLPTSIGLTSVTSVTQSVAELPDIRYIRYTPHSADVGRISLSVVKTWKPNAFRLK
ncbi:hypothetical protein, partial [Microcoleus sp. AT3-D2]|uniref:hypothetical protein n=1 Tax=Microcoleus sp. AT3-D2 TaxID=2818612 RepID=UPI002FCF1B28